VGRGRQPVLSPFLEWWFNITTDIKLLELSNLDLPVLRQLALEAPGTYHHSIVMGTIAEAAAEKVDPETWTDIMNGIFEFMIRPVYKYEGTVPRLMGDAILAFFGAPIAHEDDPQRAVLAGLEIQEGIKEYAQEIRIKHGLEFGLRVGINTGLVVVGAIGSDLRMEYTAIGDAINLAARMNAPHRPRYTRPLPACPPGL
jgi:class 3 adenylate cyclase